MKIKMQVMIESDGGDTKAVETYQGDNKWRLIFMLRDIAGSGSAP